MSRWEGDERVLSLSNVDTAEMIAKRFEEMGRGRIVWNEEGALDIYNDTFAWSDVAPNGSQVGSAPGSFHVIPLNKLYRTNFYDTLDNSEYGDDEAPELKMDAHVANLIHTQKRLDAVHHPSGSYIEPSNPLPLQLRYEENYDKLTVSGLIDRAIALHTDRNTIATDLTEKDLEAIALDAAKYVRAMAHKSFDSEVDHKLLALAGRDDILQTVTQVLPVLKEHPKALDAARVYLKESALENLGLKSVYSYV